MQKTALLISPICTDGKVDISIARGLLDILAMNLHSKSEISIKIPLFVTKETDDENNTRLKLLTWEEEYSKEDLHNLINQCDMEVDMVLIPTLIKEDDELVFKVKILNVGGEFEIYYSVLRGSLIDIARDFFHEASQLANVLGVELFWDTKWPLSYNEKAMKLLFESISLSTDIHAGIQSENHQFILNSYFQTLELDSTLEIAIYKLIEMIEFFLFNPNMPGDVYKKGLQALKKLLKSYEVPGMAYASIAHIYKKLRKRKLFERFMKVALEKEPYNEDIVVSLCSHYEEKNQLIKASKLYKDFLDNTKRKSYLVTHNLGAVYAEMGRLDDAIEYWLKSLKINSKHSSAYTNLMNAYFEKKEFGKMWVLFEQGLKYQPIAWHSYEYLINSLTKVEDVDVAVGILREHLDKNPEDCGAYLHLGVLLSKIGETKQAMEVWNKGLEFDEEHEYYEAISRQILILEIENFEMLFSRIPHELFSDEPDTHKPFLEKCRDKAPKFWPVHFFLAKIYQKLEKNEQAIEFLKTACELEKRNPIILNELAVMLTMIKKDKEAIGYFNKAIRFAPLNCEYLSNLALTLVKLGKNEEALSIIKRALAISPNDSISNSIKDILDGKFILNPDGTLTPNKKKFRSKTRES